MNHVIYGLIDPNTKELRYIGYSSNVEMRYLNHHGLANLKAKTHKNNWLRSLFMQGKKAEMIILEEYQNAEELPQAEIEMIAYYKYIGCNLTNGTNGGDGIKICSKEIRDKISKSRKGIPAWNKGKTTSTEVIEKLSKSHLGQKAHNKGISCSEEQRKKISETLKGRKVSESTKQKLSQIRKGRKLSEETKKKISEAHRIRKEKSNE